MEGGEWAWGGGERRTRETCRFLPYNIPNPQTQGGRILVYIIPSFSPSLSLSGFYLNTFSPSLSLAYPASVVKVYDPSVSRTSSCPSVFRTSSSSGTAVAAEISDFGTVDRSGGCVCVCERVVGVRERGREKERQRGGKRGRKSVRN